MEDEVFAFYRASERSTVCFFAKPWAFSPLSDPNSAKKWGPLRSLVYSVGVSE